ncbi:MAG TPA: 1-acyl-sn-glycerol-3-phosphate acyltransferase, partial [Bacteroidia bacterium]|nr:1-acyl-sn-glycerol-3-phosphate acyltransferase [Bacteroidia bacterium]
MRITIRAFFRNKQVLGLDNIPDKGPLILVANHPSTFMDPIVIAASIKRKVYFLGKAEIFNSVFAKWLFPKFNVIPVYRAQDDPSQLHKNKETFFKCFEHLEDGGVILIFPEGVSLTDRKLKKIKTGTARIALGAEEENNFTLGVKIISFGLNYSDQQSFQSDLLIHIDEGINVTNYKEKYSEDPIKAVNDLTDEIRQRIEKQIVAIEDAEIDKLVKNIEVIYKSQLIKDLGYSEKIKEHDFLVTRAINERVQFFFEKEPERVNKMKVDIETYFTDLDKLELNDRILKNFTKKGSIILNSFFSVLYLLLGFPLFVYGLINNYLPFKIPNWVSRKITKQPEFYGAITMVVGTFTFLIFYSVQLWLVHHYLHTIWITLCYLVALPLSGFFAYFYGRRFV